MGWFDVDRGGLAAILERRGKAFAVFELIQNAWDSGATTVDVTLTPQDGVPSARLIVEDNGEGFADLSHAYTMFARSNRAGQAQKRGRFNLGEKLALSLCSCVKIVSTGGAIIFERDKRYNRPSHKRNRGTLFDGELRMTRDEYAEACDAMTRLLPPVKTTFNGEELGRPDPLVTFDVKLPTEIADADGFLRRTVRMATVEVYPAIDGHGELLELGIPVVETDNGYRVNVLQKVPLTFDRDNVPPAFLRAVNVAVLNHVHDQLTPEAAAEPWAQEALGDSRATADAVRSVVTTRFGERAVVATPGNPLANAMAERDGCQVIHGGAMSAEAWANVRKHGALLPSERLFPAPTPEAMATIAEGALKSCPTCNRPWATE